MLFSKHSQGLTNVHCCDTTHPNIGSRCSAGFIVRVYWAGSQTMSFKFFAFVRVNNDCSSTPMSL